MKRLKKYIEYFLTKLHVVFEQHTYKYNGTSMKYMFKRSDSDTLLVVFSACTRNGIRARYNYVRTLKDIPFNRLFILDDFAKDHRGGYYLGKDLSFREEAATKALIDAVIQKEGIKKVIFCGSSKGGYATLNIGSQYKGAYLIPGGPQYYLATYLIEDESFITLEHIIGETTDEKVKMIDEYLPRRLVNNPYIKTQKVFLHYSDQEHTYDEHIKFMIQDMKKSGYHLQHDISDYTNHSDISYYYPDHLLRVLKGIKAEEL